MAKYRIHAPFFSKDRQYFEAGEIVEVAEDDQPAPGWVRLLEAGEKESPPVEFIPPPEKVPVAPPPGQVSIGSGRRRTVENQPF